MADATAFDLYSGLSQRRIEPHGWGPQHGAYVYVLGEDRAGLKYQLNLGDKIELSQTATVTGISLTRFRARLRGPAVNVAGSKWRFSWYVGVGGARQGFRDLVPGRTVDIIDGAFNTIGKTGNHALVFRLELVAA